MRLTAYILLLVSFVIALAAPAFAVPKPVYVLTLKGAIAPPTADYITRAISLAEREDAQAVVLRMDTPGGMDSSMRTIIQAIFASRVPVIVYVWPNGARDASAGVFITYASHIAAMSPASNIGSAHPVAIGPGGSVQMDKTMREKIENDAVKYIKSIAEKRGRNSEWAEQAVRQSVNLTAREAKEKGVIDYVSGSLSGLLDEINGRTIKLDTGRSVTLHTSGAPIRFAGMNAREKFLNFLADPNIAFILLLITIYGIIFELQNPGLIFPGVLGGISLILFLYSFAILPLNAAGLALVILAIVLFIVDAHAPTHGVLTAGGIASFALGVLMLFGTGSAEFQVSLQLFITGIVLTAGFFIFIVQNGIKALKKPLVSGPEGMVGQMVAARTDINPVGKIFTEGTYWTAETTGPAIKKGEPVRIVEVKGLRVVVEKDSGVSPSA